MTKLSKFSCFFLGARLRTFRDLSKLQTLCFSHELQNIPVVPYIFIHLANHLE